MRFLADVDILVTYLPFYRMHEVREYFLENVRRVDVKRAIVYVDNVYRDSQLALLKQLLPEVEVRGVNYRERNMTVVRILKDAVEEDWDALVVDSDNMLEPWLARADGELVSRFGFYTVSDWEAWSRHPRTVLLGTVQVGGKEVEVYGWRIAGLWRNIFFIGPKQAISLSPRLLRLIDMRILKAVERALTAMDAAVRSYISDETTLGVILYYSGLRMTPFVVASRHVHHASYGGGTFHRPVFNFMNALARAQFGLQLLKNGIHDLRVLWLTLRYRITQLLYSFRVLV